ncbi:integral membrane sensor signal transduction histidine kinase [Niallia circulans]|jgi:signal transduction histidine kinase|nr:HAMP domain-containing sensor histidine kinase [Niallia circulans]MDR4316212.1 HAMP domain-containing histidine kinase [Niallia circulans]MED3839172.1 HAMP domain-containing sensor histidine kinase [Niallia circulans]MED4245555.1 HAMP domain-containing sensor histidine kinase [Niallia circulans]MED4250605.1 HAMP domain-containing sensor histidine kinase [Niallia circulans]MED5100635.1 HAMP domain-containing sensor histidine kinase [Niallia circulans]
MNMTKRFILQFFFQLLFVFFLLSIIFLLFWAIIGFTAMKNELNTDLTQADSSNIEDWITVKDEKISISNDLKDLVRKQNGWLAILSENGNPLETYNLPEGNSFSKADFSLLLSESEDYPYQYSMWPIQQDTAMPLIVLYGKEVGSKSILNTIKVGVNWQKNQLNIPDTIRKTITDKHGWVQLVSKDGVVQDNYKAVNQKDRYSFQELFQLTNNEQKDVSAYFNRETGQVLLTGTDQTNSLHSDTEIMQDTGNKILFLFLLALLLLITLNIWFGYKFGAPLVTIMKWIGDLGKENYEEGHNKHSMMLTKKGKLQRKYKIYKELITTLTQLTTSLEQNKQLRIKANKARDEWISGLSHDLKTPLASIGGYAEMLQSDQYSWTEEEVRTFSSTIKEKAHYMKQLLEDLTLTYQLRSEGFPIAKERVEINEQIRRTVIHYVNGPAGQQYEFVFHPYPKELIAAVDPKWFQRIMENLIENAIKYNPPKTTVTITIGKLDHHLLIITISDNGVGMDNETLNRLFERYYRGTNTSSSKNGTGLGMTITKKLIELHGGSIKVRTELENGTTIRILLPLLDD